MINKTHMTMLLKNHYSEKTFLVLSGIFSAGTGFYLFLGIHIAKYIRYTGINNGFYYWVIFPFDFLIKTIWVFAIIFTLLITKQFITSIKQKNKPSIKFFAKLGGLAFIINLVVLSVFIITAFLQIDHRSSVKVGKDIYNLATRGEYEYGFHFYIYKCHQWDLDFNFNCEKITSFTTQQKIFSYDQTSWSKINYDPVKNSIYVVWNDKTLYEYQLNTTDKP